MKKVTKIDSTIFELIKDCFTEYYDKIIFKIDPDNPYKPIEMSLKELIEKENKEIFKSSEKYWGVSEYIPENGALRTTVYVPNKEIILYLPDELCSAVKDIFPRKFKTE